MWPALIAAILPVLLAFVVGLAGKYSQHAVEDAKAPEGVADKLNEALEAWKKEHGAS